MLEPQNKRGVAAWFKHNTPLILTQVLVFAIAVFAFNHFVLGNYAEAYDDSHPHTMLVCRAKLENDFSHCAPNTVAFKSHAACARSAEDVFFGVRAFSEIFPHGDGTEVPIIISCIPTDHYKALEPDKVTKEIHGLPLGPTPNATCLDIEHCPLKEDSPLATPTPTQPPPAASQPSPDRPPR